MEQIWIFEGNKKVPAGKKFALKHNIEVLKIDKKGNPTVFEYDTSRFAGEVF